MIAGRRMNFDALLRRVGRWDYSVSQNTFSTLIWERVYPGAYESLEIGYPRNDVLATATGEDVRACATSSASRPARPPSCTRRRTASTSRGTCRCSTSRARRRARSRPRRARPPALLLRCRPAPARAPPLRQDPRRRLASVDRGAVPGGGRARDRLLLDHVRLRRPRPPDRHPRARLGGLPRAARHVLRPAGRAARRGRADRARSWSTRSRRGRRGATRRPACAPPSARASARSTTAARPSASSGGCGR